MGACALSPRVETASVEEASFQVNESFSARDLLGSWTHSHEEDPGDGSLREIYRPSHWEFPPSRGRRGYEFREGGLCKIVGIAPADRATRSKGSWRLEEGVLIVVDASGSTRRMRVEQAEPEQLVLREILDR